MNKTPSQIRQQLAGTLESNKAIKFRYEHGETITELSKQRHNGRKVSKQRIHQIINNPNVITAYHQTHPVGILGVLWGYLMDYLLRR